MWQLSSPVFSPLKPCSLYKWMIDSRVCLTLLCLLMLGLLGHLISSFLKLTIIG